MQDLENVLHIKLLYYSTSLSSIILLGWRVFVLCPNFQQILLLLPRNQMPLFHWLVPQSQTFWKDFFILSSSTSSSLDTLSLSDSKSESLASPCRIPQYSTIFGLWMLRPNALTMLARMDARMTRRRVKMLWYEVTWKWRRREGRKSTVTFTYVSQQYPYKFVVLDQ